MEQTLVISEIFKSIQGETSRVGLPCTFVRTFGCNLDCAWCDTLYARTGEGTRMAVADVLRRVVAFGGRLTCITGGEPMLQPEGVCQLAERLMAGGRTVLLETNGTLDLAPVPPGVIVIMDVKCPGSGHTDVMLPSNLERLGPHDEVKFVIQDRADYDWAVAFVRQHDLLARSQVLFSAVHSRLTHRALAEWVLESGLDVRLQIQLHRVLWPESDRGV
jgi:7-carboxy-7-deazaguanine synthase